MLANPFKRVKQVFVLLFFMTLFSGCAYKNIDGSNNFFSLVNELVDDSVNKFDNRVDFNDVVLVSDFVNIDKLKNRSQLGFLLSSTLKDRLLSKNILVKEIQLREQFALGKNGFNLLSRNVNDVSAHASAKYAFIGTYSITTKRLIVFIKLIDIETGYILGSSQASTMIDDEILDLEEVKEKRKYSVFPPLTL